jgi:TonB family protein
MLIHGSLGVALTLAAAPQGQTINARHGDLVVTPPTAEVRLIRRGDAQVRAIFNTEQRSLILLVDYVAWDGHEPDNRVDVAYRFFGVEGDWPLGARWEGRAIVEDYSVMGGPMSSHGAGLRTPAGLVQLLSVPFSPRSAELFAEKPALSALSYRGGGRGTAGEVTFDAAEAREVASAARSAEQRANPGAAGAFSGVYPPPGAPVRVGGNIRMPQRIVDASPVMPEVARQAGIRGVVILEIIIGPDGKVSDVKVLRSIPQLDQAAMDAARQWRYEATLLNGAPVPVIMTATVSFQ